MQKQVILGSSVTGVLKSLRRMAGVISPYPIVSLAASVRLFVQALARRLLMFDTVAIYRALICVYTYGRGERPKYLNMPGGDHVLGENVPPRDMHLLKLGFTPRSV